MKYYLPNRRNKNFIHWLHQTMLCRKTVYMQMIFAVLLTLLLWVYIIPPVTVLASGIYYSQTVDEGDTYTDSYFQMMGFYGPLTFTNNGTVNITDEFSMIYQADFVNNGTFNFTGYSDPYSTFDISSGCTFTNDGTATISGCYNFSPWNTFINTGTLFLSDISNASIDGLSNTGIIVYGDNVAPSLIDSLKAITTGSGKVLSQSEYEASAAPVYQINYDLNGGSWKETPDNAIFSYTHDSANPYPFYHLDYDAPFDKVSNNLVRENYQFVGWICPEQGETEPTPYFTILTYWQSDITLTAVWRPARQYIFYQLKGGYFPDGSTDLKIENDGSNTYTLFDIETEDFTLPTPEKGGYIFVGWGLGGTNQVEPTVTIPKGTAGNRSYTAIWNLGGTTPYTVDVYYMDENGNYNSTPDKTFSETGTTGTWAEIPPVTYLNRGFVFDEANSSNREIITADGKLVLSLYYQRSRHNIKFMSYDGSTELGSCQGYYGTEVSYTGDTPVMEDENYIYTFMGWASEPLSDYGITSLRKIEEDKTYYAAFEKKKKESSLCTVTFVDTTGFMPVKPSVITLNKGESFSAELYLADEKYYVGTKEWSFPSYAHLGVAFADHSGGLFLGKDFTITRADYDAPVTLTIPEVTKDLNIIFRAQYHEEHEYSPGYDTIIRDATYTEQGLVTHFCYKCGKTVDEIIPMLTPADPGNDNAEDDDDSETPESSSLPDYRKPSTEIPIVRKSPNTGESDSVQTASEESDPEKQNTEKTISDEAVPIEAASADVVPVTETKSGSIMEWICVIVSVLGVVAVVIIIYIIRKKRPS